MKKYLIGLLVTVALTFVLAPVPDLITKLLYALIAAAIYATALIILKVSWPNIVQKTTMKWLNIIISAFSIAITLIGFVIVNAYFVRVFGCDDRSVSKKDIRQLQVEEFCKGILISPDYPESTKKLAAQTLENWANDVIDPDPVLLVAGYAEDKGRHAVFLYMSDEEFNIEGITVLERCLETGETLVEEYPLFLFDRIGHFQFVLFSRREAGQRKEQEAWENYVANGSISESWPEVFISLPKENELEVELEIYDKNGNRSNRFVFGPYVRIPYTFLEGQQYTPKD